MLVMVVFGIIIPVGCFCLFCFSFVLLFLFIYLPFATTEPFFFLSPSTCYCLFVFVVDFKLMSNWNSISNLLNSSYNYKPWRWDQLLPKCSISACTDFIYLLLGLIWSSNVHEIICLYSQSICNLICFPKAQWFSISL